MEETLLLRLQKKLLEIPKGKVTTYIELAKALDMPHAARAIGTTCGRNPEPDVYPCFKVVRSDGKLGGFSAPGGLDEKVKRLSQEGIEVVDGKVSRLEECLHRFA